VLTIAALHSVRNVDNWIMGRADLRLRYSCGISCLLPTDFGCMCVLGVLPETAIMGLALRTEYMSRSYSRYSHVMCITPIQRNARRPVLCPLAGIHRNRVSIE
jgi:hypothetical protein